MEVKGRRIFVGLSGGVDSAVSATLLKQSGADVTGVFIKGWYPPSLPCTWADDRRDAMRVAAHLRIPFHTLDAGTEYKEAVIDYLLAEYAKGRTPNPDTMCNRDVKFGAFYKFAKSHGADLIATGHYARTELRSKSTHLLRGLDSSKDQSYFLWSIPKETLADTVFPIGHLHKSDVRALAKKLTLPVAEKKDSQGVCFLGSISVEDFLREELHPEPGKILDSGNKEIGIHDGAILHTLGERISVQEAESGPWYVIEKDMKNNTLTVSHEPLAAHAISSIQLNQINWFNDAPNDVIQAQYRYHGPLISGVLTKDVFKLNQSLNEPLAPGQSLVMYKGEECLGGGIIS